MRELKETLQYCVWGSFWKRDIFRMKEWDPLHKTGAETDSFEWGTDIRSETRCASAVMHPKYEIRALWENERSVIDKLKAYDTWIFKGLKEDVVDQDQENVDYKTQCTVSWFINTETNLVWEQRTIWKTELWTKIKIMSQEMNFTDISLHWLVNYNEMWWRKQRAAMQCNAMHEWMNG